MAAIKGETSVKTYTLRPGIAAIFHVWDGRTAWSVIFLGIGKPLEVSEGGSPLSTPEDLPAAVLKSCAAWFARVFAEPLGQRGEFIRTHGSLRWQVQS
jgi:hypothetical protein